LQVEVSKSQGDLSSLDVGVVSVQLGVTLLDHADPDLVAVRPTLRVEWLSIYLKGKEIVNNDGLDVTVLSEFQ